MKIMKLKNLNESQLYKRLSYLNVLLLRNPIGIRLAHLTNAKIYVKEYLLKTKTK